MEKIKIEKNTVQETLIIPLYGRKMCSEKFSALYTDIYAKKLCDRLDYDFSELEKKNNSFLYEFGALEAAMRQLDIIWEIKEYLKIYPKATIVNLGCGLDETGKACDIVLKIQLNNPSKNRCYMEDNKPVAEDSNHN